MRCDVLSLDQFVFEALEVVVVKVELEFQRAVRHPAIALQQLSHLR
jgi:hypothetical protein